MGHCESTLYVHARLKQENAQRCTYVHTHTLLWLDKQSICYLYVNVITHTKEEH